MKTRGEDFKSFGAFKELPIEIELQILNASSAGVPLLSPHDVTQYALCCRDANCVSSEANSFFNVKYKQIRDSSSEYHKFKEENISNLWQKRRTEEEIKRFKEKELHKITPFQATSLVAFVFISLFSMWQEMSWLSFSLLLVITPLVIALALELINYVRQAPLDSQDLKKIPILFAEKKLEDFTRDDDDVLADCITKDDGVMVERTIRQ